VCLIGADIGNINTRIGRFANYLRNLLPSNDTGVMELAAQTVGKLALVSGTYAAEYFEFEVKRAFEWLGGDRHEGKRLAAVSPIKNHQKLYHFKLLCNCDASSPSGISSTRISFLSTNIFLPTSSDFSGFDLQCCPRS